jgi:hypothetical protein
VRDVLRFSVQVLDWRQFTVIDLQNMTAAAAAAVKWVIQPHPTPPNPLDRPCSYTLTVSKAKQLHSSQTTGGSGSLLHDHSSTVVTVPLTY